MKNLLKFIFLQLFISSAIFGTLIFLIAYLPTLFVESESLSPKIIGPVEFVYIVILCGIVFGLIPCSLFAFLTQKTFLQTNFKLKSLSYWFLSYAFTMTAWTLFSGRGTGELTGDYLFTLPFVIIAGTTWYKLSPRYLQI